MPIFRSSMLRALSLPAFAAALTGCMQQVHNQGVLFASAATPVVQQAGDAYHTANLLYDESVDLESVRAFTKDPVAYNPRTIAVLLPNKDIEIRLKVLKAIQLYADTVVAITKGTASPELNAAATSAGGALTDISNQIAPAFESTAAAASVTSPVTPAIRNGISTAANALGQFLVYRTIERNLPPEIVKMDGTLKTLCELLNADIDILQDQQKRDYDTLIEHQKAFILNAKDLNAEDQRTEIMKLPAIVRRERASDAQLAQLKASIVKLYETHHALAEEIKSGDPESLKKKIGELETAGSNLGTFYSSLPTT